MGLLSAFAPQVLNEAQKVKQGLLRLSIPAGQLTAPKMAPISNASVPRNVYERFQGPGLLGALFAGANAAIGSDLYEQGLQKRQDQFLGSMKDPRDAIQEANRLGRTDWVDRLKQQQATDQEAAQKQQVMAARQQAAQMLQNGDYEGASRLLLGSGDVQSANAIWSGQENKAQANAARIKALGQTAASLAQGLKSVTPERRAEIVSQYAQDLRDLGATDDLLQDMAAGDDQTLDAIINRGMTANEFADNQRLDQKQSADLKLNAARQELVDSQIALTQARTATERALASARVRKAQADAASAEQEARLGAVGRRTAGRAAGRGGNSGGGASAKLPAGFILDGN